MPTLTLIAFLAIETGFILIAMRRKVIIFGVTGQDGYYLSNLLQNEGFEVIGIARKGAPVTGDISNYSFVEDQIKLNMPDYIFHLAANSTTRHDALFENHLTISTGTINILESVRLHSHNSRVFLSGSAMQFKNDGLPISETTPFEASSPYSVARIQSVYAGRYFRNIYGIKVYVGYFFNHDSPRRGIHHVNQMIVHAVQNISRGSSEKLEVGNLDVKKEFNFAGDSIEAAWLLVNQEKIFEANIGSGEAFSIKEWIVKCFEEIGRNWEDYTVLKPGFAPEYKTLVSNPKLILSLGWKPKVGFNKLVSLMMAKC